jgi:hypothetical protein
LPGLDVKFSRFPGAVRPAIRPHPAEQGSQAIAVKVALHVTSHFHDARIRLGCG